MIAVLGPLCGCAVPQWRVGQAKVPEPLTKPAAQIESERRAARLIAERIESPPELKPVAVQLSASLGEPQKSIAATVGTPQAADQSLAELRSSIAEMQRALAKQNALLAKYAGKEIEGTGLNLFGPSMSLVLIGLVALGVACPPLATLMFFVLRRLRETLRTTVSSIESFSDQEPDAASRLRAIQSRAMDRVHKRVVKSIKAKL